jgi:hypothetical protein
VAVLLPVGEVEVGEVELAYLAAVEAEGYAF